MVESLSMQGVAVGAGDVVGTGDGAGVDGAGVVGTAVDGTAVGAAEIVGASVLPR